MEIIIQESAEAASKLLARHIAALIYCKPGAVLGLATGSTPLGLYQELIRMHREEELDFSRVRTFNLDEYLGLSPSHPQSYHHFMWKNLFDHINVNPAKVNFPSGLVSGQEINSYCQKYEEEIAKSGGIDLQILGIGSDGHIGFNEAGSSLASRTRIKTLTRRTIEDNARFFGSSGEVPHHVITMGVGTIMEAREIALLAFGPAKAHAVAGAVEGPITASNPASILQMHPTAKVYLDEAASGQLARCAYYRWVYEQKPDWQKLQ
ncbi:MAG: glucosamine-6-phosphate deaminase [Terrimicrobiaceae bacterium]